VTVCGSLRKIGLGILSSVGLTATAHAACPANNLYSYSFGTATAVTLSYATTYSYTASNALGQTLPATVTFTTNGLASTLVAGNQMPNISTMVTDGTVTNNLVIGGNFGSRTPSITGATRVITTTFTFSTPIRDLTLQVNDIDQAANQYRDWFYITGSNGASTYTPSMVTPFGNNNGAGPTTNASSTVALGPSTTPFTQVAAEAVGNGTSGNNANNGTITASFVQPVTSVTLRYGNYALQAGETTTGQQAYGIQSFSFCPMPGISMVKTSAPFSSVVTDPNRFNIPGSDVIYSLTVSNTNSSPVDAASLVLTDPLPAPMTFYNGDIDGAGPITTNFEFVPGTSGLTFSAANLTYSNNAGASYVYSPVAGYDPSVNALRLNPQGAMAANSSFTIKFRTRIK
jgi:hypothetical protein